MTELSREDLFRVAAAAFDGTFPDVAVKYLARALEMDPVLNQKQQDLLFATYRDLANRLRKGIEDLNVSLGYVENEADANALLILKGDLCEKLTSLCREFCSLVSESLLPKVEGADRAVYFLVIADFYRFIAELETGDSADAAKLSLEHYSHAKEASSSLPVEDPVHLNIILNMAKLMNDVMGQTEQAVELAQSTYNEAMPKVAEPTSYQILQALKDNMIAWVTGGGE